MDAWIKTGSIIVARKRMNVASLADAWIKIIVPKTSKTLSFVASFTGAWIKIKTGREPDIDWTRRIPRGCVD